MSIYYEDATVTLHHGDCLDVLRELPNASVDSVVCDPPYSLSFMGREWDRHDTPADFQAWCEQWATECLRVLKPGGHLLAFGGTRTWHRLACAVEDAGFEVRDSLAWMYGSGFPKSLDVSKAIDKARNDKADVLAVTTRLSELARAAGITRSDVDAQMGTSDMGGWWLSTLAHRCACPSVENWARLRDIIPGATDLDDEVWRLNGRKGTPGEAWATAEVTGVKPGAMSGWNMDGTTRFVDREQKAANSPEAEQWQGWGTALKPAFEPIVVARKPLTGTVAQNVLAHGTGALNIGGCRIGESGGGTQCSQRDATGTCTGHPGAMGSVGGGLMRHAQNGAGGRWPANVVLDESQAEALDEQSGTLASGYMKPETDRGTRQGDAYGVFSARTATETYGDTGGASRFFYVAKADASERPRVNGTAHPTVKPLALMRWLVRLVTPPGGTVLEPFAGSGTTVEACILESFRCVAIEKTDEYLPLIEARIARRRDPVKAIQLAEDDLGLFNLFGEVGA